MPSPLVLVVNVIGEDGVPPIGLYRKVTVLALLAPVRNLPWNRSFKVTLSDVGGVGVGVGTLVGVGVGVGVGGGRVGVGVGGTGVGVGTGPAVAYTWISDSPLFREPGAPVIWNLTQVTVLVEKETLKTVPSFGIPVTFTELPSLKDNVPPAE